jgi:hypothetical protein
MIAETGERKKIEKNIWKFCAYRAVQSLFFAACGREVGA